VITEPYYRVTSNDIISLNEKIIGSNFKKVYIKLYKPRRYLSDLAYNDSRDLAVNLIKISHYVFPVGRLDYNSEGLILFTNDGDFAYRIMHPKFGIEKEYHVKLKGQLNNEDIEKIIKGFRKNNINYMVERVRFLKKTKNNSWYSFIVKEGKNRMIRIIGDTIGHPVLKLIRVRIGSIKLGNLKPGEYRKLTEKEINSIQNAQG